MIGPHVVINGPTLIGADNRIFQFASIGDAPQDKKYRGEPTRLEIGDRNVFRESCTINRGTTHDQGVTRIGNDNLFMAYSHVAHDCVIGNNTVFANCASLGGHVEIGDWVILGGLTAVHQFTQDRRARLSRPAARSSRATCRPTSWWPAIRRCRTRSTPRA